MYQQALAAKNPKYGYRTWLQKCPGGGSPLVSEMTYLSVYRLVVSIIYYFHRNPCLKQHLFEVV